MRVSGSPTVSFDFRLLIFGRNQGLTTIATINKQALKEAKTVAERAKLKELYDLKRQRLLAEEAGAGIEEATRRLSTRGTFSAFGLWGFGAASPLERTATATEQTAKHTKRLVDQARNGGLVFTN